ncbi:site-specific integrase [Methylotenera mobilis]|jgi:site-specific recombinase XerD|uniref:site-specific integrase n=1 Tax=Methylotenera mobilis TaxID=359408 RepID=UPI000371C719|nr:site-specific integrase [Methylotenera mobilis]
MNERLKSEIQLVWPKDRVVPVPLIGGLHLHSHLSAFLVTRYYYPKIIRDSMPTVTGGSLRQIAYDLKVFLEGLAHNGVSYLDADYTNHIEKIVEAQLGNSSPSSYNTRLSRIRDFYDYLCKEGIRVKARFPARIVQKRYQSQNDNFLSHTNYRYSKTYEKDDGHKRTTLKEDYKDDVIDIKTYGKLYQALKQIDVVYAVIAQVMMQTFLRIADICEMPLHSNKYNQYLPLWPEFERVGKELLRYKCLTKRMKPVTIDIYPMTLKAIYEDYIQSCYQDRKDLFDSFYMKRSNATLYFGNIRDKGRRSCPEDILWLTKTGAPVKPYMIEEAFRATGMDIHPHMLRHTGPTHTLWNYCRIHGIEPDVRLASTFQQILQEQMGHADIETTRMYIRTIIAFKGRRTMPFCIPDDKKAIDDRLAGKIRVDVSDQMARFFEYRSEHLESQDSA